MNLEFNQIQQAKPKRNFFDLSHERKFSLDMGYLVPIMCQEVLPADSFSVTNQQLLRFAPMLAPVMHKVDVYTHYFFVPNRIVWDNWDEFITGNQGQAPEPAFPYVQIPGNQPGTLADYMGVPAVAMNEPLQISAIPFAGYNKIYNEYYRDQNLQPDELFCDLEDGNNSISLYSTVLGQPRKRAWEHDYFTSALPFTQKGEEVMLTFDTEAVVPISYDYNDTSDVIYKNIVSTFGGEGNLIDPATGNFLADLLTKSEDPNNPGNYTYAKTSIDNSDKLSIDLSGSYLMTVNELRKAVQLQKWLELNARAGSRYIETILAHFGVRSDDARLQRPEYLGGGKSAVSISEVLQTSESSTTPQGTMAGHGINYGESHEFKSYFKEHGYIIGIMSVMPKTNYQQGVPKHFLKNNKLDFYWNTFAHLGEQEIKKVELYVNSADRNEVFGYVPRYSEYKFINSSVHGDFTNSLDFWHMGRIFDTEPSLNSDFIECNATDRIFAVTDDNVHSLWCHLYQQVKAVRPMPVFGTPLL